MLTSLLIWAVLAAPTAPESKAVFWVFPGPYGVELRTAMVEAQGDADSRHLISVEDRDRHLAKIQWQDSMGCVDDSGTCLDAYRGVLKAAGFDARVLATAERDDQGMIVTLKMNSTEGGSNQRFVGRGPDLTAAAKEAMGAIRGRGSLNLTLEPKDASFRINGESFGQGSGEYQVPAGEHTLTVEALNMRTAEEKITIVAGQKTSTSIKLQPAFGRVSLVTTPEKTRVFLNGAEWADPKTPREIEPGIHKLRVTAEKYVTHSADITVKPSISLDLTLKLRPKDPPWRKALKSAHADTVNPKWTARLDLRMISTRNGPVEEKLRSGITETLNKLEESSGAGALGLTIGWRHSWWSVDVLGITFDNGYDEIKSNVMLESGTIAATVTDCSRTMLKAGWVGLRYPMWRIEPYFNTGLGLSIDRYEGRTICDGVESCDEEIRTPFSITDVRPIMGVETGFRYSASKLIFGGIGTHIDFWPGKRSNVAFLFSGGVAFDPTRWF